MVLPKLKYTQNHMKIIGQYNHHYLLHAMFDLIFLFKRFNLMKTKIFIFLPFVDPFVVYLDFWADDGGRGISTGRLAKPEADGGRAKNEWWWWEFLDVWSSRKLTDGLPRAL